ncbi:mRNA decay activator protein ZFP36L2 [Heterodontus francisci]|uniref:mRNA decay activator protein ZFP36L2 n=1 Tax=Heterodontus francisci TaxID=7792 RepID=UPI00355C0445
MSATLLSAFYDINDFLCNKNEKSLNNYNNFNSMLDKKAVGTPVTSFAPGFLRRHSTSNLQALANNSSTKYPSSSFPNIKESNSTAMLNKENKFRDRSFSESAERQQQQQQAPLSPLHLVQQQQKAAAGGGQVNSTRYKTELCRPFEESGTCKYGDKCQFAHGMHELRSLTRHPKYKTELCRTFHTIGFCPYGPRCHFIHNAEERRQAPCNNNAINSFHHQQHSSNSQHQPRPKLHHSLSFSGFPSGSSGLESPLLESPTSRTPPPPCSSSSTSSMFCEDLLSPTLPACANNAFTFSSQELSNLLTPLAIQTQQLGGGGYSQQQQPTNVCPPSPPYILSQMQSCLRRLAESPVFDAPPSPPDSLSDRESYLSGSQSSGSLSGSESPSMDPGRRLPIFSRLSISED